MVRQMSLQVDDYEPTNDGPPVISEEPIAAESAITAESVPTVNAAVSPCVRPPRLRSQSVMVRRESVHTLEEDVLGSCLRPKIDGRIICLTPEVRYELIKDRSLHA